MTLPSGPPSTNVFARLSVLLLRRGEVALLGGILLGLGIFLAATGAAVVTAMGTMAMVGLQALAGVYLWRVLRPSASALESVGMALAIGILTAVGMIGFIRGFAVGEASVIGPTEYIRLIFAAGFGLLIFGEIPDRWTMAGALVIVACTSFIARMEARKRTAK